jgi:type IV secretion system protein VirD4
LRLVLLKKVAKVAPPQAVAANTWHKNLTGPFLLKYRLFPVMGLSHKYQYSAIILTKYMHLLDFATSCYNSDDRTSIYLAEDWTSMLVSGEYTMPNLLLGWPLKANENSKRYFTRSRRNARFSDISLAESYKQDGHLITFAPTGAGKGIRVIIPNLLHYRGPVIVVDPKGENFAVTARYRRERLGQRIFLLDPFEAVADSTLNKIGVQRASLNPLDLVCSFQNNIEVQLTMMASILSENGSRSNSNDVYWEQEAQKITAGALGVIIRNANTNGQSPVFQSFIDLLFSSTLTGPLETVMGRLDHSSEIQTNLYDFSHKAISAFQGNAERTRSCVLSFAQSHLTPFLSSSMNKYLNYSTIKPRDISDCDDYTIYIVIPPSKLVSHSMLLRLWIATMLNTIMERGEKSLKKTLFLLDECAQLGRLDELKKAITLLRGYGLQVWMFFQDFSQIVDLYPTTYATMINNCGAFQSFGSSRLAAAEAIANSIGKYKSEDITKLGKTQQIISIANRDPQILRTMNYLNDDYFKGLYDPNPLFAQHNGVNRGNRSHPPLTLVA